MFYWDGIRGVLDCRSFKLVHKEGLSFQWDCVKSFSYIFLVRALPYEKAKWNMEGNLIECIIISFIGPLPQATLRALAVNFRYRQNNSVLGYLKP